MITEFTPETSTDFNSLATSLGILAVLAACFLVTLIGERAWGLWKVEGMNPFAALLRGFFQVVIGSPLRLHLSRVAAVRADSHVCADRAHAMLRHPSAQGYRHLSSVPSRVA